MAAHIKYCLFKGRSDEDPDAHIWQFNKAYGVNNLGLVVELHKQSIFESSLAGRGSNWLAKLPVDHF